MNQAEDIKDMRGLTNAKNTAEVGAEVGVRPQCTPDTPRGKFHDHAQREAVAAAVLMANRGGAPTEPAVAIVVGRVARVAVVAVPACIRVRPRLPCRPQ